MQTDAPTTGLREAIARLQNAADNREAGAQRQYEHSTLGGKIKTSRTLEDERGWATLTVKLTDLQAILEATQGAHEGVIEACAKVAEQHGAEAESLNTQWMANKIATAIRALSSGKTVSAGVGS